MSIFQRTYTNPNPITPKDVACAAKAEAEKIASCESFEELRKWACPKALSHFKNWYITCVDCPGVETCKPGKRVVELLEKQTRPDTKKSRAHNSYKGHLAGPEACKEAMKHDDPISYLMEANDIGYESAKERIRRWKIMYPDIVKDKNIPTKQRKNIGNGAYVTHQKMINRMTEAFSDPEGPAAYLMRTSKMTYPVARRSLCNWANKYPELDKKYKIREWLNNTSTRKKVGRKKMINEPVSNDEMTVEDLFKEVNISVPEEKPNRKEIARKNAAVRTERARKKIIDGFAYEEGPIAYIMRVDDTDYVKARAKVYIAAKSYPDLEEKYHIFKWLEENKKLPLWKQKKEESVDANLHEDLPEKPAEDISLNKLAEQVTTAEVRKEAAEGSDRMRVICDSFSAKRVEILLHIEEEGKKIKDLQAQIESIEKTISLYREDLKSLDSVAKMMGLLPKASQKYRDVQEWLE